MQRTRRLTSLLALSAAIGVGGPAVAPDGAAGSFPNGRAPASALSPVAQGGCVKAPRHVARSWNSLQLKAQQILPANGCASAYRTLAKQVELRRFWCSLGKCGNAAPPGTSNHGSFFLGAIDTNPSTVVPIVNRLGALFGWCKIPQTVRGVSCFSDAAHEPWHIRYTPAIFNGQRNPCVVREGDRDACVRGLKRRLRAHGCKHVHARSAVYGARARACLVRFQTAHKLAADGVPGPATWRQLYRDPPPTRPVTPAPAPHPQPGPIVEPPPAPEPSRPAHGVDVSAHQGSVDWARVPDKYTFAILKTTEGADFIDYTFGTRQDPAPVRLANLRARVAAARAEIERIGCYHYLHPRPGRSGAVEARFYIETARQAGCDWRRGRDIRPVLDVEETHFRDTAGRPDRAATCRYVLQAVRAIHNLTGRRTLLYTFPSAGETWFRCTWIDERHRLWIAHPDQPRPTIPSPWHRFGYAIWQTSFHGRVSGFAGEVDLNVTTTRALAALTRR